MLSDFVPTPAMRLDLRVTTSAMGSFLRLPADLRGAIVVVDLLRRERSSEYQART